MWTIDGSMGEGGGQILRTALALALVTGTAFRIHDIRRGRRKAGLLRQHLTAVRAAAEISGADVTGDELASTELVFRPGTVRGGAYRFATGGAGSTTLVFQTVLYPLLVATDVASTVRFEGGTHNPMAPTVDFLAQVFVPLLARMDGQVALEPGTCGFYPAGGGAWSTVITPRTERLGRLELLTRGTVLTRGARAFYAKLPGSVAVRELDSLSRALGWERALGRPMDVPSAGPGNALVATIESEHVTESFTAFGERGVRAEDVAAEVARQVQRYLAADVPVFDHLADQLLLPMALGAGGVFRTVAPSAHTTTQLVLLERLLGAKATVTKEAADVFRIEIAPAR